MIGISVGIDDYGHIYIEEHIKTKIKRNKGKSIIDFPNEFVVIDIETTGLSTEYDDIIEIAAIKVKDDNIIDAFESLVHIDYELDDFIINLTGITNEMLANAPNITDVLGDFYNFVGDSILLGHNVNFDINFLYDSFLDKMNIEFKNNFIDTLRIARKLLDELDHHRLSDLCEYYKISSDKAHRALEDCKSTFECYINLKNSIKNHDDFIVLFNKFPRYIKAKDISANISNIDKDNIFYNKIIVFTGTLEKMQRKDAMQIVANMGGINADSVTSKTNFLVLGNNDYCTAIKDGKSNKHRKAEQFKLKGKDIEIIPEDVFYEIVYDELK